MATNGRKMAAAMWAASRALEVAGALATERKGWVGLELMSLSLGVYVPSLLKSIQRPAPIGEEDLCTDRPKLLFLCL